MITHSVCTVGNSVLEAPLKIKPLKPPSSRAPVLIRPEDGFRYQLNVECPFRQIEGTLIYVNGKIKGHLHSPTELARCQLIVGFWETAGGN